MRVLGLPRAFYYIARHPANDLSLGAQERLRYLSCGQALRQRRVSSPPATPRRPPLAESPMRQHRGQRRLGFTPFHALPLAAPP